MALVPSSDLASGILNAAPPLPLTTTHWQAIVKTIGLSPRQAHIIELMLRDLTDQQIALVLGISKSTIETHKRRIHQHTSTRGRMALARLVLQVAIQVYPLVPMS